MKDKSNRYWLNEDANLTGSVSWTAEPSWIRSRRDHSMSGSLEIRDCSRSVTLDFYGSKKENKYKLKMLKKAIKEFEEAMKL